MALITRTDAIKDDDARLPTRADSDVEISAVKLPELL